MFAAIRVYLNVINPWDPKLEIRSGLSAVEREFRVRLILQMGLAWGLLHNFHVKYLKWLLAKSSGSRLGAQKKIKYIICILQI